MSAGTGDEAALKTVGDELGDGVVSRDKFDGARAGKHKLDEARVGKDKFDGARVSKDTFDGGRVGQDKFDGGQGEIGQDIGQETGQEEIALEEIGQGKSSQETMNPEESGQEYTHDQELELGSQEIDGGQDDVDTLHGDIDVIQDEPLGDRQPKDYLGESEPAAGLSALTATKTNATATSNGRPYSIFTSKQKWFISILAASAGIFSPISTNIYVPAIPTLANAFGVSSEKINLTVTIYLVFQALTPAIWGSAADAYGRRPIYIICLLIYLLSCVGTALCPTSDYWLLVLMRILQATGGSAVIAIGTGVIADISLPQERGKYIGIFNLQSTLGPALGPLLGGVFAYTLGWRSIFWFLAIACGVVLVPMICFQPETLRSLVGNGSIPPPLLNRTPAALLRYRRENQALKERGEEIQQLQAVQRKFKPWASLVLLLEPEIILLFLWASLYYALWYAVLTLLSTLLQDRYKVSDIVIGLSYIPNGVGCGLSSILMGRAVDKLYRKEKDRVGGDHRTKPEEFRLERVRFTLMPLNIALLIVSCIGVGWSMQENAPIAVPIVLNIFVGLGTGFLTLTTLYGIDLFPGQSGAITATFNLVRCLFGAASVSVIQLMNTAMGAGWSFVVLSGIGLLGSPMPFIVLKFGPKWRLNRMRKAKDKAERKLRESEQSQQV